MILALADWLDELPVRRITWSLPAVGDVIETRGGVVQVVETTSRQWEATAELSLTGLDKARDIEALLDMAAMPGTVVEVTPVPWRSPRLDPQGEAMAGISPTVSAVSTDGRQITLSGMPPGYWLSPGDWLSTETTGINSGRLVRLYRLQAPAAADANGILGPVSVAPRIDPVVQAGQDVRIVDPVALAVMIPSGLQRGRMAMARWEGATITLRQTLAEVQP